MSHAGEHHEHHGHGEHGEEVLMAHGSVLRTGITNGKIAMWLFLGSEVIFFTGLIGAYIVLRFGQETWADPRAADYPLNIPLTALNTFLLICSSVTLVWGLQNYQANKIAVGNFGLLVTTLFGATFVGIQVIEYEELWRQTDPVVELAKDLRSEKDPVQKARLEAVHKDMDGYFKAAYTKMSGVAFGPGEHWSSGQHPTNLDLTREYLAKKREPAEQKALESWLSGRWPDKFAAAPESKGKGDPKATPKAEPAKPGATGDVGHAGDAGHAKAKGRRWLHPTRPHSDLFASCFYAMTSFHGLHVAIGVGTLAVLTVMGYMGKWGPKNYNAVENAGLYWHFVDLVWIILFAIVYLM